MRIRHKAEAFRRALAFRLSTLSLGDLRSGKSKKKGLTAMSTWTVIRDGLELSAWSAQAKYMIVLRWKTPRDTRSSRVN